MLWLVENMGTIVTALVICGLVFLAVRSIWRDKKSGKSCASCGGCSSCSRCHGGCSGGKEGMKGEDEIILR